MPSPHPGGQVFDLPKVTSIAIFDPTEGAFDFVDNYEGTRTGTQ